jgi:hypothetical protein
MPKEIFVLKEKGVGINEKKPKKMRIEVRGPF